MRERTRRAIIIRTALCISRCLLAAAVLCTCVPAVQAKCPEPPETDQGSRKGLAQRNFTKALRHELHVFGGVYANDLLGTAPHAGLSYTFHVTEDFGIEASLAWSYFSSSLADRVESYTGYDVAQSHHALIYAGNLVWHPIHGKFMLFNSIIPHFDIFFTAGLGLTDSRASEGLTYNFGAGIKIFSLSWLSVRMDLRDHIHIQQIMASESITNNIVWTLGVGFWFPFSSQ
ncbi:MAG: outer membrane beta-barrel domain-containing protein [Deltaproteobacteria bacterium]|nr:outer membrane beta-barrel domain-containing protein [Deltaproteobacteria bacterium]